ncbi:hypothetical protein AVEN_103167-1 [Araneus ventricosus]|uniref:Uncharacterized protein n=1 Tax=Araneus ventricosus TaxID=182803 RepID=A0A4Y2LGK7_ARAVE|nr:hypothetical protein AVEN_103167-1 [Araneus ventricosus]
MCFRYLCRRRLSTVNMNRFTTPYWEIFSSCMTNLTEMDVLLHGFFGKDFPTVHVSNRIILVHFHQTRSEHRSFTDPIQWQPQSTSRTVLKEDVVDHKPCASKRGPAAATGSS